MDTTSKILLCIDGLALAFYIGFCYGKRIKRRKRRTTPVNKRAEKPNKPIQIEVNVENKLTDKTLIL